jgi:uncharacterized protein (TIGR03083 family)
MDAAALVAAVGADPVDLMDREAQRIERFYAALDEAGWAAPTRCADWNRRQLLAHLAAVDDYTRAGLDGALAELSARAGVTSMDDFNAWGVRVRDGLDPAELLATWRAGAADNRRRLRERGLDGTLDTSVGPYPVGQQAFYLASELAIHADDAAVPVTAEEQAERTGWRARFAMVALAEADRGVTVESVPGRHLVGLDGEAVAVDDDDFVAATAGRLRADHPLPANLRTALAVLS